MLSQTFKDFCESLKVDNTEDINKKFKSITKRLNKSFWESESEEEHGYIVGSLGRNTAIKGVSDLDMLFVLPNDLFTQYNNYEGNGQSALLQRVKNEIKIRYPNTKIRGDGQVVIVSFSNYEVEVCPAFEETDGSYTYPDSNNGGKWKKTDPMPEIEESLNTIAETNQHFLHVSNMMRAWKNNIGFKMGGLLIDTLVYNFFNKYPEYKSTTFENYLSLFQDLFRYLKNLNKEQKYWFAIGSNQHVYNKDGKFVTKAKNAYTKIDGLDEDSDELYGKLQEIFGKDFPIPEQFEESAQATFALSPRSTAEQFIEDIFPIDIKFNLKINCEVKQNGFREALLRTLLLQDKPLLINKQLTFFIEHNEIKDKQLPFTVYWKVRNRGDEAIRRNHQRGGIERGNEKIIEFSSFKGEHYVECYIIYNNRCVARDFLDVPISLNINRAVSSYS